jgi:hypothetical protein
MCSGGGGFIDEDDDDDRLVEESRKNETRLGSARLGEKTERSGSVSVFSRLRA